MKLHFTDCVIPGDYSTPELEAAAIFDSYFSFSGREYRIINSIKVKESNGFLVEHSNANPNIPLNILRVISFLTMIIPLIMLVGKLICRSRYDYFLKPPIISLASSKRVVKGITKSILTIFGKEAWKQYFNYEIEGPIPSPPDNIVEITKTLRNRLKHFQEVPECSLLLLPKGLSLNKLKELLQDPVIGNKYNFYKSVWDEIFNKFGDQILEESYWVLMTNDVLEESVQMSYEDQLTLIAMIAGSNWDAPLLLEAATCCFMNYATSKVFLFGKKNYYTRCQERMRNDWHVGVMISCRGNLDVFDFDTDRYYLGIAPCLRFK